MLQISNTTPFQAALAVFPDPQGVDTLYVTVKGTFHLGQKLTIAEEQAPLTVADEYWGEPASSSLKYATDIHPQKPSTDVTLSGHAQGKDRKRVDRLDVSVAVAGVRKTARVFGDREWTGGLIPPLMTAAMPFETMPLVYERAFGGSRVLDEKKGGVAAEPRNPVGCGFVDGLGRKEIKGRPLPNIEDPSRLLVEPGGKQNPCGFGQIAASWEPRRSRAGTYDEAWLRGRAPYLPADFDARFLNCAHPDLVCKGYLTGGEPVELINVSPAGPIRFALPRCELQASVNMATATQEPPLRMESVLIEPDQGRLCLLWRAALPCDKRALKIRHVDLTLRSLDVQGGAS